MSSVMGADKLIDRILQEAKADADSYIEEAQKQASEIQQEAERQAAQTKKEAEARAKLVREDILERSRTNAKLNARKHALEQKRALMEEVFAAAHKELAALDGERREQLLKALLMRECEGGEEIRPAQKDAQLIKKLIQALHDDAGSQNQLSLRLGAADESIEDGFIAVASGYEKNCSFEAAMRDLRELKQAEVARILFE